MLARAGRLAATDVLVAGLCLESGLPLVTTQVARFRAVHGLEVVTPSQLLSRRA